VRREASLVAQVSVLFVVAAGSQHVAVCSSEAGAELDDPRGECGQTAAVLAAARPVLLQLTDVFLFADATT